MSKVTTQSAFSEGAPLTGVVAILSEAQALDALEQCMAGLSTGLGRTYLLLVHGQRAAWLAPQLQRLLPIPVLVPAPQDKMTMQPDHLYVLSMQQGWTVQGNALWAKADGCTEDCAAELLLELAAQYGPDLKTVILAGQTELPGAADLRAVTQAGGQLLVLAPETSHYSRLPRSVLAQTRPTAVLGAEDLAVMLSAGPASSALTREQLGLLGTAQLPQPLDKVLASVTETARQHTGQDFAAYRWTTLLRRIDRRMQQLDLQTLGDYQRWLSNHPDEATALKDELLINGTRFFRDRPAFAALEEALRELVRRPDRDAATWRVWVPACSSGEEAYSIAMLLTEVLESEPLGAKGSPRHFQIFATDISPEYLDRARQGHYSQAAAQALTPERRARFLEQVSGGYRVRAELRQQIVFAQHDVIKDPPLTDLDLISCRNLVHYLRPEVQRQVLDGFAAGLRPAGLLLLGVSEPLSPTLVNEDIGLNFDVLDSAQSLFRRSSAVRPPSSSWLSHFVPAPELPGSTKPRPTALGIKALEALSTWTPPAAVVSAQGELLWLNHAASQWLGISVRPGAVLAGLLPAEVQAASQAVLSAAIHDRRRVQRAFGETGGFLSAEPLPQSAAYLVVFDGVAASLHSSGSGVGAASPSPLDQELSYSRAYIQDLLNERELLRSDLRAIQGDLLLTQETRRTLQDLLARQTALPPGRPDQHCAGEAAGPQPGQFTAGQWATMAQHLGLMSLCLDTEGRVQAFTPALAELLGLSNDSLQQPLPSLHTRLRDIDLTAVARQVVEHLTNLEQEVATPQGQWFHLRATPCVMDDVVGGVLINLAPLVAHAAQQDLEITEQQRNHLLHQLVLPVALLDDDLRVMALSRGLAEVLKIDPTLAPGQYLTDLLPARSMGTGWQQTLDNVRYSGRPGYLQLQLPSGHYQATLTRPHLADPEQPHRPADPVWLILDGPREPQQLLDPDALPFP
ncbi:CheR family methyltransferase [Deinococcus radiophilus]|nr:CheR family methyltransferase [Deinococcus radiophilus]UFA49882.1 PAS domain-containing protein [Deinococcus radiophilus]